MQRFFWNLKDPNFCPKAIASSILPYGIRFSNLNLHLSLSVINRRPHLQITGEYSFSTSSHRTFSLSEKGQKEVFKITLGTRLRRFGIFTGISNTSLCWICWAKTRINVGVYLGLLHIWRPLWKEEQGCELSQNWDVNGGRGWWVRESSGRPIFAFVFLVKKNWTCTMTRHVEPSNILFFLCLCAYVYKYINI